MNRDTLQGQWKQMKGKVRAQWGRLTDDELEQIAGNYDRLIGKIQEKYGQARDEVSDQVDDFLNKHSAKDEQPRKPS
jgi:uncharacterized protein YjbJ (UPF0337 family)